jgi:hypothetical protein
LRRPHGPRTLPGKHERIGELGDRRGKTFAKGGALKDPAGLFNFSLGGDVRRAIDNKVDETALANLFRAAVALNVSGKPKP